MSEFQSEKGVEPKLSRFRPIRKLQERTIDEDNQTREMEEAQNSFNHRIEALKQETPDTKIKQKIDEYLIAMHKRRALGALSAADPMDVAVGALDLARESRNNQQRLEEFESDPDLQEVIAARKELLGY